MEHAYRTHENTCPVGTDRQHARSMLVLTLLGALLLASCEEVTAPLDHRKQQSLKLIILADIDEVWPGETVLFTVQSPFSLPENAVWKWVFTPTLFRGNVYTEAQVTRSVTTDTLSFTFEKPGSRDVILDVEGYATERPGNIIGDRVTVTVREITNQLRIEPATILWDAEIDYRFTISWGNRLPPGYRVRWNFGDGTIVVRHGEQDCVHRFRQAGSYEIIAELIAGEQDSVLGRAYAGAVITPTTPGRYLRLEIRNADIRYSHEQYARTSTSHSDSIVWRCDSLLQWEGDRFWCIVPRKPREKYALGYSSEQILIEGRCNKDMITEASIRLISILSFFGYDSTYRYARVRNLAADKSTAGKYIAFGAYDISSVLREIQFFKKRSSYPNPQTTHTRLEAIQYNARSSLSVILTHSR